MRRSRTLRSMMRPAMCASAMAPLDGFEASELAVHVARANGVSRTTAPDEDLTLTYVGPDPGPPIRGLRIVNGRIFFATGDDLYAAIDNGDSASVLATLPS